ncbi:MAG: hypothetical protein ACD_82C00105G0002 [uncultured bacterium]|nr:MAG: hypothetical protein ACD_82C00105G0002 [uncultured bacterium]KKP26215.1 MAG: hypothetical protein UR12_C0038G0002 [candidate division TM6 bacterium GW2011_GWF2_30_66]
MKILALDIGDKWVGSAICDPLGIVARPFKTVTADRLELFLSETIGSENIKKIVVGYPKTMRGTESDQTKKIVETKERLEKIFDLVEWVLWDERLSSKMANNLKFARTKEEKVSSHSVAASFILDSYLNYLHAKKMQDNL